MCQINEDDEDEYLEEDEVQEANLDQLLYEHAADATVAMAKVMGKWTRDPCHETFSEAAMSHCPTDTHSRDPGDHWGQALRLPPFLGTFWSHSEAGHSALQPWPSGRVPLVLWGRLSRPW